MVTPFREIPPGLPHHPDCPCCDYRLQLKWARKSVEGLRGARVRDAVIRRVLTSDGLTSTVIDHALSEGEPFMCEDPEGAYILMMKEES